MCHECESVCVVKCENVCVVKCENVCVVSVRMCVL